MKYFIFIISLLVIFIAAASISFKAGDIKRKCVPIIVLLLLEGAVAYALLHTSAGLAILHTASGGIEYLIHHANRGIDFVFGDITAKEGAI